MAGVLVERNEAIAAASKRSATLLALGTRSDQRRRSIRCRMGAQKLLVCDPKSLGFDFCSAIFVARL